MKSLWGAVGAAGGSGANPEKWAVRGFLRSLSLLKHRMAISEKSRLYDIFLQPKICPQFQFPFPRNTLTLTKTYIALLKYMFAGNIGVALQQAFRARECSKNEKVINQVRSMPLQQLHFFDVLRIDGEDPSKKFRTHVADTRFINHRGVPRVGSNIFVKGISGMPSLIIKMMVGISQNSCVAVFLHICACLPNGRRCLPLRFEFRVDRVSILPLCP